MHIYFIVLCRREFHILIGLMGILDFVVVLYSLFESFFKKSGVIACGILCVFVPFKFFDKVLNKTVYKSVKDKMCVAFTVQCSTDKLIQECYDTRFYKHFFLPCIQVL